MPKWPVAAQCSPAAKKMDPTNSSKDLVRRLKEVGDEESVRMLIEQYGARLLAAAVLLCGNHADAQDLMVETFQMAVRDIAKFGGRSSLFSWLYGILLNLIRMLWRKRSRSRIDYVEELPETAADTPHPGSGLDDAAAAKCLANAIRQLSEPLQSVVILRYYAEMSIAEVAETLKIRPGTVKSRLFSAMEKLRDLLPEEMRP